MCVCVCVYVRVCVCRRLSLGRLLESCVLDPAGDAEPGPAERLLRRVSGLRLVRAPRNKAQ